MLNVFILINHCLGHLSNIERRGQRGGHCKTGINLRKLAGVPDVLSGIVGILAATNSILVNADNQGAIKLAKNPAFHKRSKHIDVKYHFIRSEVQQGTVSVRYIASEDNLQSQ